MVGAGGGAVQQDGTCPGIAGPSTAVDPILLQARADFRKSGVKKPASSSPVILTDAEAQPPAAALDACTGTISWRGRCVDVSGGNSWNGNAIQLWDCQGGNQNQQFILPSGTGQIRWAANSGKCLDARNPKLELWDCDPKQQFQQFLVSGGQSGVLRLASAQHRCVDVKEGGHYNGVRLQTWDCSAEHNPNPNQVFDRSCQAGPTVAPPLPSPGPSPHQAGRKGSFLVIGDWGFDRKPGHIHGAANAFKGDTCQKRVADHMHKKMKELGDVKFVINVGDSFYTDGVNSTDDPQWDSSWRNVYSPELRSVPWYSTYGNHDYHQDPCACHDEFTKCAQHNSDRSDLNKFYMPSANYIVELPKLDSELVVLDTNYLWTEKDQWIKCHTPGLQDPHGFATQVLKPRNDQAFQFFHDRVSQSPAKNLLVVTHYPTVFCETRLHNGCHDFVDKLKTANRPIELYTGHTHYVEKRPTTHEWVSGGGGGYSCDEGKRQGIVVGEIAADGTLSSYEWTMPASQCCPR